MLFGWRLDVLLKYGHSRLYQNAIDVLSISRCFAEAKLHEPSAEPFFYCFEHGSFLLLLALKITGAIAIAITIAIATIPISITTVTVCGLYIIDDNGEIWQFFLCIQIIYQLHLFFVAYNCAEQCIRRHWRKRPA